MTYIGQQPSTTFDSGIQDRFTGLSTNTVTLNHEISAEEDILVVWNNIVQDKNTYSVGGTGNKTLTLGGTLVSADVVTVYYLNKVMQSVNPTAGSVNTDQLATNAVTNAKMADDAIGLAELSATGTASSSTFLRGDNAWATVAGFDVTSITGATELTATPQRTDEFVMSDDGTLKRIDHEWLVNINSPFACNFGWSNDQSVAPNTQTRITGFSNPNTSESNQRTGTISTSPVGRITPGEQGYYFMQFIFNIAGMSDGEGVTAYIYSSHADTSYIVGQHIMSSSGQNPWVQGAFVGTVGNQNNNYFELQAKHNHGSNRTIENGHFRIFKLATKNLP